jgi:molybdate transport system regulatory protein
MTGMRLLQASALLSAARNGVIAKLNQESQTGDPIAGLASLSLRTSMRNQLPCKVQALSKKNSTVRVELALADDASLFSRITRESAQLLGLHPGQRVLALCKATAVRVAQHLEVQDGFNLMSGRVTRASVSKNDSEIGLHLPSGLQLVGFAHSGHGLRKRDTAMASIEESGVVIAISG